MGTAARSHMPSAPVNGSVSGTAHRWHTNRRRTWPGGDLTGSAARSAGFVVQQTIQCRKRQGNSSSDKIASPRKHPLQRIFLAGSWATGRRPARPRRSTHRRRAGHRRCAYRGRARHRRRTNGRWAWHRWCAHRRHALRRPTGRSSSPHLRHRKRHQNTNYNGSPY